MQIAEKSNEIPAIKPLLTGMGLQGRAKAPSLPSWQRSMTPSAALKRVTG